MIQFLQRAYAVPNENLFVRHNTKETELAKTYRELAKILKSDLNKKTLIVHLFAGHGVQLDGQQAILINEHDRRINFYKRFPAEKHVRHLADSYYNSYNICLFACCRET